MCCKTFFQNQRIDRAGVLAVRLEKLILVSFILSCFALALFTWEMVSLERIILGPVLGISAAWLVWMFGWKGAVNRNPALLFMYFLLTFCGSVFLLIAFFLTSIGGSVVTVVALNECASNPNCPNQDQAAADADRSPLIILMIFGISTLLWLVPLFFNIIGLVLSFHCRRELLGQKGSPVLQKIVEDTEAFPMMPLHKEVEEQPQQQQQQQIPPQFYIPQPQQGQGFYMPMPPHPMGYQPVSPYPGSPQVMYIPAYPGPHQQQFAPQMQQQ